LASANGCSTETPNPGEATAAVAESRSTLQESQPAKTNARLEGQIAAFCGGCHATPRPEHFPRAAWREEVEQGFHLFYQSSRTDLTVPVMAEVIAYYERGAPRDIELPPNSSGVSAQAASFLRQEVSSNNEFPAVAHLNWTPVGNQEAAELVVCDMASGSVLAVDPRSKMAWRELAKLVNPAHAESCDLDGDGRRELLVADLGSFLPSDHDRGRVVWLRPTESGTNFEPVVLANRLGRMADAQAADFDGDGDLDVVVSEFGWRATGHLWLLDNCGFEDGQPRFERRLLDPRHGAIHVPVCDWNQDGRPDFTCLFSQEHEAVEIFLNRGSGQFESQRIFAADRPSFGSSGIHLSDLDSDGDTDILYTNGDMFDDYFLRTYHAVHWLENRGPDGWATHELAQLPGVHRALTADLDGDGDLDIVACALIPQPVLDAHPQQRFDSLIWLEQTAPGTFERHALEVGDSRHASLTVGDFDADGDIDLAVGNYVTGSRAAPLLTMWWNQRTGPVATTEAVSNP